LIRFAPVANTNHRLRFDAILPIDIVPCGGVESETRMIAWPPDHEVIMNGVGLREACEIAVPLEFAAGLVVPVVPVSGLAALKLLAWQDRRYDRDAHDLRLIASQYLDTDGRDRIYEEHPDLFNDDFDYERTGAQLLGRDIRQRMGEEIAERLRPQRSAFNSTPWGQLHENDCLQFCFLRGGTGAGRIALRIAIVDRRRNGAGRTASQESDAVRRGASGWS
jgi:predicted nucleotidyltransferase